MRMIHINRDRQNLGQFRPEAVSEGLREGRFLPTDLAWQEGMETWQPLATFTDLPPAADASTALSPDNLAAAGPQPVAAPAGAPMPAWEERERLGYVAAALETIRQTLTNPVSTYRALTRTGGLAGPFTFCYLMQILCGLVGLFETAVWLRVLPASLLPHLGENPFGSFATNLVFSVPMMFAIGLVIPFLFAGIYFLLIRLVSKAKPDFETIFRAYCYSAGSLAIINVVPIPPIPAVQATFILFIGIIALGYMIITLREAVGITTLESTATVLLPMILCCFCIAALTGVALAMAGSIPALQNLGH